MKYILAIDAGTTGVRVILFDSKLREIRSAYSEFRQYYPKPGWVEHDALEIWKLTQNLLRNVARGVRPAALHCVGITNQRETIVCWDSKTGKPLHRAIVWQCRRSSELCSKLKKQGLERTVRQKTGLYLDPYFSASKLRWLMENSKSVQKAAQAGTLRVGTIDSWLILCLTRGQVHATDFSNASRTMLFDIQKRKWDKVLLSLFKVPARSLPQVLPSAADYGSLDPSLLGRKVPITGVIGDQQSALFGQAAWNASESKITYGTGCFWMLNTGRKRRDIPGFLSTIAADCEGQPCFAIEGSVFIGGAVIQWLRDSLKAIPNSSESEKIANSVRDSGGVFLVPAFVGLGAPYWDPDARGAILGLTRGSTREHIVRAALESIAYQNAELVRLAQKNGIRFSEIRVDGGASRNNLLLQIQSDLLGLKIARAKNLETTALGAAAVAALGAEMVQGWQLLALIRKTDRRFLPRISQRDREEKMKAWQGAVQRVLAKAKQSS